jgi:GAF domain-containing protein
MPSPLPPNERQRLEALLGYDVLDTGPERPFDDVAHLAANACRAPIAIVGLTDADRHWFKAQVGVEEPSLPRADAICAQVVASGQALVVEDAAADPRFAGLPWVAGEPFVRFYAGAPLVTEEGLALGTVCAMDPAPRAATPAQIEALAALARQAVGLLTLRVTAERRRALLQITNAIISQLQLDDLLRATFSALHAAIPFERSAVTLYDEPLDRIRIYAFDSSRPSPNFRAGLELPRAICRRRPRR